MNHPYKHVIFYEKYIPQVGAKIYIRVKYTCGKRAVSNSSSLYTLFYSVIYNSVDLLYSKGIRVPAVLAMICTKKCCLSTNRTLLKIKLWILQFINNLKRHAKLSNGFEIQGFKGIIGKHLRTFVVLRDSYIYMPSRGSWAAEETRDNF